LCMKKVFKFLELEATDKEIIKYLEKEDFPNGQANKVRVSHSKKVNTSQFGNETDEVFKILEPVLTAYKSRQSVKIRWGDKNNKNNNNNDNSKIGNCITNENIVG